MPVALALAPLAGCSSCVKEESQPASTGPAPDLSVNNNKLRIVDRKMQPRIGEEGGFLFPVEGGADGAVAH